MSWLIKSSCRGLIVRSVLIIDRSLHHAPAPGEKIPQRSRLQEKPRKCQLPVQYACGDANAL